MKMKKIFLLGFLLVFLVRPAVANEQIFQKANEAYTKSAYDSAIYLYNKILDSGYESAEVYFNLGNAHFKNKDIAQAVLNFERAHQLSPTDNDITFNLQLAQTLVVDKINVLPPFFLSQWWENYTNLLSSDSWALLSIVFFMVLLISVLAYLFSKTLLIKKLAFWMACFFLLTSLQTFVSSYQIKNNIQSRNSAIIMAESVTIKSSPDEKGTEIFVLHEGVKVWVLDEIGSWLKIKIADGNSGWIRKQDIERI